MYFTFSCQKVRVTAVPFGFAGTSPGLAFEFDTIFFSGVMILRLKQIVS